MESDVDFIRDENFKLPQKKDVKKGFGIFPAFSAIGLHLNLGLYPRFDRPGT